MKKLALVVSSIALVLASLQLPITPVKADIIPGDEFCNVLNPSGYWATIPCMQTGYAPGSYQTRAGDLLYMVCLTPGYPLSTNCYFTNSVEEQFCTKEFGGLKNPKFFCKKIGGSTSKTYITSRGDGIYYRCNSSTYPLAQECTRKPIAVM